MQKHAFMFVKFFTAVSYDRKIFTVSSQIGLKMSILMCLSVQSEGKISNDSRFFYGFAIPPLTTSQLRRRRETQHNDTQHNDTQHNDTKRNDTQHNDTQHNDTQHNDTQHNDSKRNDTQHNDTQHNDTQHNDT
jgi:hypothetical protein